MASFMSSLTRRQADRTLLMLGICVFMFRWPSPNYFVATVLATSPRREQAEKAVLIACVTLTRTNRSPVLLHEPDNVIETHEDAGDFKDR